MKKLILIFVLAAACAGAAEKVSHRFIAVCFRKGEIQLVNKAGETEWTYKPGKGPQDAWMLPNGNILVSHTHGAQIVTVPDSKVVWEYKSPEGEKLELHSVQPLPNGNVLVLECGSRKLMEIGKDGKPVKTIVLETTVEKAHNQFRSARKTPQGTYVVGFLGEAKMKEFDSKGKLITEILVAEGEKSSHACIRLPNGNTLVSTAGQNEVKEFDKNGKLVWHLTMDDMTAMGITKTGYTAGLQRLPNGNTVLAIYGGDPQYYEVTRDKKLVWQASGEKYGHVSNITILDGNPNCLKGEVLK